MLTFLIYHIYLLDFKNQQQPLIQQHLQAQQLRQQQQQRPTTLQLPRTTLLPQRTTLQQRHTTRRISQPLTERQRRGLIRSLQATRTTTARTSSSSSSPSSPPWSFLRQLLWPSSGWRSEGNESLGASFRYHGRKWLGGGGGKGPLKEDKTP